MYSDELKVRVVPVESIYLDPNNPRFWNEVSRRAVPDERVSQPAVQQRTGTEIDQFGVSELYGSMLRSGFLLLDRIVVRPLKDESDRYVIVEGNRRFRSLSKLRSDIQAERVEAAEEIGEEVLGDFLKRTASIEVLVYEGSDTQDISWIFQGIRHISGIKAWAPAQRAKLVADQIDHHGSSFSKAAQQFGLSSIAVGRMYRAHRALRQMELDEEYGGRVKNDYYSLFYETVKNAAMRTWLEWDETRREFQNLENLRRFYAWISPCEDHGGRRRIHDPHQVKDVAYLIENCHNTLLAEFEGFTRTIHDAKLAATAEDHKDKDWRQSMRAAELMLGELPQSAIADDADEFLRYLRRLSDVIADRIQMVELVVERLDEHGD